MFIITAKLDRRRLTAAALALVVLVAIAVLLFSGSGDSEGDAGEAENAASVSAAVKNNAQRIRYLESYGWKVSEDPIDSQKVTVPKDFSKVYETYNDLQRAQGFDLSKYSGLEATRYTYEVTNHPTASGRVVADMLVCKGKVIAGDIQSISAENGFMEGLRFPEK